MKRLILLLTVISWFEVFGQISEGGIPVSFKYSMFKSSLAIPAHKSVVLNTRKLLEEDALNGITNRYSEFEDVRINLKDGLNTSFASENGQIWQYQIVSENAFSIQIMFSRFILPPGAKLYIYNNDYSLIFGAYTEQNNQSDSIFIVGDFKSDHLIIEYFEPFNASFSGQVEIGSIGQAYKDILNESMTDEDGFIDINCLEGKDWQVEKHAICKITFKVVLWGYLCSGSFINNANQDKTPYFLTANHCIDNIISARTAVAYFNYERESCYGKVKNFKTLSGSSICTRGEDSDFCLLKFSQTPPASYLPYYAGWDARDINPLNGTCIHHPEGMIKKISKDFDEIKSYPYSISWDEGDPSPDNTHWGTNIDIGNLSGGSSGSPIFNSYKRIFGQLHGGVLSDEYYGKLSYSFIHSERGYNNLKSFLDPKNTGIQYLDGYAPANNRPDAYFISDFTNLCTNAEIQFNDYSTFLPTSWNWEFSPPTVTFAGGTSATSKNPKVIFNQQGNYDVSLTISNNFGNDEMLVDNYIQADSQIQVDLTLPYTTDECFCDFDSLIIQPYGASIYTWEFEPAMGSYFNSYNINNTKVLKLKPGVEPDSSLHLNIHIAGTHGTCVDSLVFSYALLKRVNDGIANALPLELGVNGPFTNRCATIELNEPIPPFTSCTGQKSWCNEYSNGENIVENSVWYYINGPSSGVIGIRSEGFDNQIAVYEANSYEDILNGNFIIIAANDDYTDTDWNATIKSTNVIASKKYWLQIDGSGGGSEGEFYLKIYSDTLSGTSNQIEKTGLKVYPQPAIDNLTIESDKFISANSVKIEIYSFEGSMLYSELLTDLGNNSITISTNSLPAGIYFISININGEMISGKFIK